MNLVPLSPAQAGAQAFYVQTLAIAEKTWVPAFAGTNGEGAR